MAKDTEFKEIYVRQVKELFKLGAKNKDIENFFDVTRLTIIKWREEHPKFDEAIRVGRRPIDEKVAKSVLSRILGYNYIEESTTKDAYGDVIHTKTTKKHCPPEGALGMQWLVRRWPDLWEDFEEEITYNLTPDEAKAEMARIDERRKALGL